MATSGTTLARGAIGLREVLGEIAVPTLLVGGRYDECTPSHLAAMHQRIRGSQLRIIEDASHLCFAEQPAEFAKIVNAFFDLTDRGSSL
jgi:proline iminopeptidase